MPVFRCDKCGCMENTALSNYWNRGGQGAPGLCSECDPGIGKWHGHFPKQSAVGMIECNDGFLYDPSYLKSESGKWRLKNQEFRVVRTIKEKDKTDGEIKIEGAK